MRPVSVFLALCPAVVACGGEAVNAPPSPPPVVASVVVTPDSSTLESLGETVQLGATARNATGGMIAGKTFVWSPSDVEVATVNSSGLVAAVAKGTATITATVDGVGGDALVIVAQPASITALYEGVWWVEASEWVSTSPVCT